MKSRYYPESYKINSMYFYPGMVVPVKTEYGDIIADVVETYPKFIICECDGHRFTVQKKELYYDMEVYVGD